MTQLVLSLFPGIGLLDMAFEEEGFCVVRGPDLLWGGDIRRFHPPAGKFDGVIGGPPCQMFSPLGAVNRSQNKAPSYGNLIPEFERVVAEAAPAWFVMENVYRAPIPSVRGYAVRDMLLDAAWLGSEQGRLRRFSLGFGGGIPFTFSIETLALHNPEPMPTVTTGPGGRATPHPRKGGWRYSLADARRLQGLPHDFLEDAPFTALGKLRAIANGVPLPMGRAVARAVKRALGLDVPV